MYYSAHSLKGSSSYICANTIYYLSLQIKLHCHEERFDKVTQYYQSLVEAAIEYKIYSRMLIAKHKNHHEKYMIQPGDETIEHSEKFVL